MSLFESLGQQQPQTMQDAVKQLRADPSTFLKRAGLSVPAGMNDPQQIVNHLLQSGQVSSPRLQMAQRMLNMMRK